MTAGEISNRSRRPLGVNEMTQTQGKVDEKERCDDDDVDVIQMMMMCDDAIERIVVLSKRVCGQWCVGVVGCPLFFLTVLALSLSFHRM